MLKKFFVLAVAVLAACGDEEGPIDPGEDPTLTLTADSVNVAVGGSTTVTAIVTNTSQSPEFISRNEAVAEVTATGTITGVGVGTTFIVSQLPNRQSVRDSVRVRVGQNTQQGPIALPLLGTGVVNERWTAEVAAAGNVAYTTTWSVRQERGNAIKIWNVTGNQPILVDSLIVQGNVGATSDVQITPDGAFLVASYEGNAINNGLRIWSRTDPLHPTFVRHHNTGAVTGGVHTVKIGRIDGRTYAFASVNTGRIAIIDITNPAQSTETRVIDLQGASVHDVFIRDGVLFAALYSTGLRIYDVGGGGRGGSPSAPVMISTLVIKPCDACPAGNGTAHNVWWFHDPAAGTSGKRYALIGEEGPGSVSAQESTGAIHVIDVSNFSSPVEVAVYDPDPTTTANSKTAGAHNFVMDEPSGILYAAYYNAGVRALDVRGDLSSCTQAEKKPDGRCDLRRMGREVGVAVSSGPPKYVWGVALVGNHVYASDMWNGIHKIDISALKR